MYGKTYDPKYIEGLQRILYPPHLFPPINKIDINFANEVVAVVEGASTVELINWQLDCKERIVINFLWCIPACVATSVYPYYKIYINGLCDPKNRFYYRDNFTWSWFATGSAYGVNEAGRCHILLKPKDSLRITFDNPAGITVTSNPGVLIVGYKWIEDSEYQKKT
jgi:hypothetical protein